MFIVMVEDIWDLLLEHLILLIILYRHKCKLGVMNYLY